MGIKCNRCNYTYPDYLVDKVADAKYICSYCLVEKGKRMECFECGNHMTLDRTGWFCPKCEGYPEDNCQNCLSLKKEILRLKEKIEDLSLSGGN